MARASRAFFYKILPHPFGEKSCVRAWHAIFCLGDERPAYRDDLSRARIEDDKQKYIQQVEYFLL